MNGVIEFLKSHYTFTNWLRFRCSLIVLAAFALIRSAEAADLGNGNTGDGSGALSSLSGGQFNTGLGANALHSDTSGSQNTATGWGALFSNTSGGFNMANGVSALFSNTTGGYNTASGDYSLYSNTTGSSNTAVGYNGLFNNTGDFNIAIGLNALYSNTTGYQNVAVGVDALYDNTTGVSNIATGIYALMRNTTGNLNIGSGYCALYFNQTGSSNVAIGDFALFDNTGDSDIAIGHWAGRGSTGSNNIYIGNVDPFHFSGNVSNESNTIRIGASTLQTATYIAGISGANEGGFGRTISTVYINDLGQLGTAPPPSSRRFKKDVKPMNKASEAVLRLKPVSFHYKADAAATAQFGLIAEEVEQINPDLVARDSEGKAYTVRYEAVNAMLLNEFLKEHRKMEELQDTVMNQQKAMQLLVATVKQQAAEIQQVKAELQTTRPDRQVVNNN